MNRSNASRRSASAIELRPNERLARAARDFATYLAQSGRFEHHADGRDVLARARAAGYQPWVICENLFECRAPAGITSTELATAAVTSWLESAGHRRNLLDGRVREIGVGVAGDPAAGRYYVVEILAWPRHSADSEMARQTSAR